MASEIKVLMGQCRDLRERLLKKKMSVESLEEYIPTIFVPMSQILCREGSRIEEFEDFLYLCLDYYTFTDSVLISDHMYDMVMNHYLEIGGERMIYADTLDLDTKWNLVPHEEPGVVGSLEKIYSMEELEKYWRKFSWCKTWIVAPKFDGISSAIKVQDGKIALAVTRYDGVNGQDITEVIRRAKNVHSFEREYWGKSGNIPRDGFYKVELCVGMTDFNQLNEEKTYANRRSATSGIVNSPKNLEFAHYITIIPLMYYDPKISSAIDYNPLYSSFVEDIGSWKSLYQLIMEKLNYCRMADFEFRSDGVVLMPMDSHVVIDQTDLMSNGIAYKVNTEIGLTHIKDVYVSVGRMGKAIPMASVVPVEVNETMVSDISLGSFAKAIGMGIHEDEVVEVFSAGDVIPQMRLPEERIYPKGSDVLIFDLHCPYCKEKLKTVGKEVFCVNPDCERIITGKITNFVSKLGAQNISDATIEDLYESKLISSIADLFKLKVEDIANLEGYAEVSAKNIIDEIQKIKDTPTYMDKFFGALGIPDIGEKTARKIFSVLKLKDLQKKRSKIEYLLLGVDGIGSKTAESFLNFLEENYDLIQDLLNIMYITPVRTWLGNVCFTGYRDPEAEAKFAALGYETSNSVNSKTLVVITNSLASNSSKIKDARKRDIEIITASMIDDFIETQLKHLSFND